MRNIWSNIKKQEYQSDISSINPESDLAVGYMQKVAGENNDAYQQGAGMNSLFPKAGWGVPTEIHKNISEKNKKTFKTREDKQYISAHPMNELHQTIVLKEIPPPRRQAEHIGWQKATSH